LIDREALKCRKTKTRLHELENNNKTKLIMVLVGETNDASHSTHAPWPVLSPPTKERKGKGKERHAPTKVEKGCTKSQRVKEKDSSTP
jgi:hypothetical protein